MLDEKIQSKSETIKIKKGKNLLKNKYTSIF